MSNSAPTRPNLSNFSSTVCAEAINYNSQVTTKQIVSIAGNLSEYSLAELFILIEKRQQTGLLTVEPKHDLVQMAIDKYYVWFQGGRVIATAHDLLQTTLLAMLQQRQWLTPETMETVIAISSQLDQPLGIYLKSQGLLSAEQLKLIFHAQTIQPLCKLFKLDNARFTFDPHQPLVKLEMTGLSISGTEITLLGLRSLRDWSKLTGKLPNPESALVRRKDLSPNYKLDLEELEIWQFSNGQLSIRDLANELNFTVETAQKIAFRLIVIGLVREVAIVQSLSQEDLTEDRNSEIKTASTGEEENKPLTGAFLNNLIGFLKNRKLG